MAAGLATHWQSPVLDRKKTKKNDKCPPASSPAMHAPPSLIPGTGASYSPHLQDTYHIKVAVGSCEACETADSV